MVYVVYREVGRGEESEIVASFVDKVQAMDWAKWETRRLYDSGQLQDRYFKIMEYEFEIDDPRERDNPVRVFYATLCGIEQVA